jgi:IS30 family transposase
MPASCHKYTQLSIAERAKIELLHKQGQTLSVIATELCRNKATISRELCRYKDTSLYRAELAQHRADMAKSHNRKKQKSGNPELMQNIERMIKRKWSPEIIAHELGGIISHTTIYTITKTIRTEWRKHLAYQKQTKYRKGSAGKSLIPDRADISLRPTEVEFGDYEADTVIGNRLGKSCLGVFVERTTRLYKITKLHDKSAKSMVRAAVKALSDKPVRSITYDNGAENAKHCVINWLLKCRSWFCRAYCSCDKGLIENRNKILRQWLPKGTNFDLITEEELSSIENEINERPMKCLNWQSPKQAFHNALQLHFYL